MGQVCHSDESTPYILLIGGDSRLRAMVTYGAREHALRVEPVSFVKELRPSDWQRADVIIAWHQFGILDELHSEMHRNGVWVPIVLCMQDPTISEIVGMIESGATDIVEWPESWEHLAERVRLAMRKSQQCRPRYERAFLAARRLLGLSKRELEVLEGVAAGLSNKEVARQLSISHRTVEIHRSNMLSKLRVKSTPEAVGLYYKASFGTECASQLDMGFEQDVYREKYGHLRLVAN